MKTNPPTPTASLPGMTAASEPEASTGSPGSATEAVREAPPVTRPRQHIHTVILPLAAVALDIEIREAFLGSDIEVICAAAGKTGSTLLIINADKSLEQREAAFALWRKRGLENLAVACPEIREFLAANDSLRIEYNDGVIDLLALDRLMHDARETAARRHLELLASRKKALQSAVEKNTPDHVEGRFPRFVFIRGDGEMKLFRIRNNGQVWGSEGNHGYYLVPLTSEQRYRRLAEGEPTAGPDDAELAEAEEAE